MKWAFIQFHTRRKKKMPYSLLISLGFQLGQTLLNHFVKAKAPQEVLDGIQSALDAIEKHALDTMTKDDWEALRG
jgi:hypothetical protein